MLLATKCIWVTFQKEGIHAYPAAATEARLAEVSFLANRHRHMFHFRVWLEVFHDDRDVEFILFKRELEQLYTQVPGGGSNFTNGILETDYKSCEMLAQDLINYISNKYPRREMAVEVSEDGENGAIIRYNPHPRPIL